ncbi:hypothetical protein TWF696_001056 [Orbilia brochopaga]|uniref:EcxA zinc-binding domain-containing protein n=1 Tax=Orbilia brochopaga TaxID=3140254 RepID=A0AAV9VD81_9PEZI
MSDATTKLLPVVSLWESHLLKSDDSMLDPEVRLRAIGTGCESSLLDATKVSLIDSAGLASDRPLGPAIHHGCDGRQLEISPGASLSATAYHCRTQPDQPFNYTAIQLGYHGRISRYYAGVTISYYVGCDTFPTSEDAEYVAKCFKDATQAWDAIPVKFERVSARDDAFFSVLFSKHAPDGSTPAKAFFPNSPPERRTVTVYSVAFAYRDAMVNIFCHELGHVLGLRHEFAAVSELDRPSVLWGVVNPESVMNYYNNPLEIAVHPLDILLLESFYSYDEEEYGRFPIDTVWPTPGL